jgi:hypothetical protein
MVHRLANSIQDTWLFGLIFVCLGFISGSEGDSSQTSGGADWVTSLAFAFVVALWVVRDARRREKQLAYDFPAFVFFCWPVFGPLYLFQTRGVRAFLSLLVFLVMALVGGSVGVVLGLVARN